MPSPLPLDWVDRLFGRLAIRFGSQWLHKWEGLDMKAVKLDWADQLAGLQEPDRQHALRYGIEHLPADHPPTAAQFRALCARAPEYVARPALPAPELEQSPEGVARMREKMAALAQPKDPRAWAHALKARHQSGDRLTPAQIDAYREALEWRRFRWESA